MKVVKVPEATDIRGSVGLATVGRIPLGTQVNDTAVPTRQNAALKQGANGGRSAASSLNPTVSQLPVRDHTPQVLFIRPSHDLLYHAFEPLVGHPAVVLLRDKPEPCPVAELMRAAKISKRIVDIGPSRDTLAKAPPAFGHFIKADMAEHDREIEANVL